jgi:type II secretory pathway pseudopilin PulG
VLAITVLPHLMGVDRKAKEADLCSELRSLRAAIQQFDNDCGDYPVSLDQLLRPPKTSTGGSGLVLDANDWRGPYLIVANWNLPKDPFTASSTRWSYAGTTGEVHSGSTLISIKGEAYSSW